MRLVNAKEPRKVNLAVGFFIVLANKLLMMMWISSAPPSRGGNRAFTLAAWNIRCRRNAGLFSPTMGLAQMGVVMAVLMEAKATDNRHSHLALG